MGHFLDHLLQDVRALGLGDSVSPDLLSELCKLIEVSRELLFGLLEFELKIVMIHQLC